MLGRSFRKLFFWGGLAAAAKYLFDPEEGRTRRANLQDQIKGLLGGRSSDIGRSTSYATQQAYGAVRESVSRVTPDAAPPNDETLKEKIESEVLRHDKYPKGDINIDVVGGVVTLRGEVKDDQLSQDLEQEVRKISGVVDVESLLHPPGEPAPNKKDALQAGRKTRPR